MAVSQIRFMDGSYRVANSELKLAIESIFGTPVIGDGIIMFGSIWTIREINKSPLNNWYEVITVSDTIYVNDLDLEIADHRGNEVICGLSLVAYKLLSAREKIEYLKTIAELNPFKPIAEFIKQHIQLCVAIFPVSNSTVSGFSKIGGMPVATRELSYPRDKNGNSTLFICQIHLNDINQWCESTRELNGRGILYFFGSIRVSNDIYYSFDEIFVRYSEQDNDLIEIPLPGDIIEYGFFEEKDLAVIDEISLPPIDSTIVDEETLNEVELNLCQEFEDIVELYNYVDPPEGSYYDSIRLMGYPQQLQHCIFMETVSKNLKQGWYNPDVSQREVPLEITDKTKAEALQWRHLFSFPTDPFRKMSRFKGEFNQFMDGFFNVMIKKKDLDIMNFDNTESVYQFT